MVKIPIPGGLSASAEAFRRPSPGDGGRYSQIGFAVDTEEPIVAGSYFGIDFRAPYYGPGIAYSLVDETTGEELCVCFTPGNVNELGPTVPVNLQQRERPSIADLLQDCILTRTGRFLPGGAMEVLLHHEELTAIREFVTRCQLDR